MIVDKIEVQRIVRQEKYNKAFTPCALVGSFPVLMGVKLNELSSIDADMLLDKRHKKGVSSSFIKCVCYEHSI